MGLRGRRGGRVRLGRVWCISGGIFIWLNDCMSAVVVRETGVIGLGFRLVDRC